VNNLTGQPLRMHRDNQADRIGRYDEYGRRYLVDLTLKFSRPDRQSAVPFRSSGGPAGGGLSALT
jgi:hypothetical protein